MTLAQCVFRATFLAFLFCSPLHAEGLLNYDAALAESDPEAQGWKKRQGNSEVVSAEAGTVDSTPVWNITDTATGDGSDHSLSYCGAITPAEDENLAATGWSLSASVAVPGTQTSHTSAAALSIFLRHQPDGTPLTGTDAWLYIVYFGSKNGQLQIRLGNYANSEILWTADTPDPVTVELRFTPDSGKVSLHANGNLVADDYLGSSVTTGTLGAYWGKQRGGDTSRTSSWASVKLQTLPKK